MAEQDTITFREYIEKQDELEKEARELFPKKFDICSNSMGYIRQPVYACLTCNPNPSEEAGFCYSCSMACHGDHNLVELFTKRSFRCDCGTEKFKDTKCQLDPKPAGSVNELNQYNHNYLGRFCWCAVQYDPMKEESTMLQCVVCEDWFHDTCIGITPHNDDFDDFICRTCTRAHPFLRGYAQHSLFMIGLSEKGGGPKSATMVDCSNKDKKDVKGKGVDRENVKVEKTEDQEVDIIKPELETTATTITESSTITTTEVKNITAVTVATNSSDSSEQTTHTSQTVSQVKRSLETTVQDAAEDEKVKEEAESSKRPKLETETCKRIQQPADAYPDQEMNLFATEGWRDLLCQCGVCLALYSKENVSFILGEEAIYEDDEDEDAATSILEGGMKKLNEMDRVEMMNGMLAYNKMRDEVLDFLAPFKGTDKVVTVEDVQAFFKAKMEQRATLGGKPNFF